MPTTCNITSLTFDITGTAALYSQLAGVLAAFAFGAISIILPGAHRRGGPVGMPTGSAQIPTDAHVLLALVAAFMSLIISTIEYAVLAGERGCALVGGRAASEEFLGGMAFAFSVLLLLYAVVQLVAHSGIEEIGFHARLIVALLAPPLAILFLLTAALDVAYTPWALGGDGLYRPQSDTQFIRHLEVIYLSLPIIVFALCLLGWLVRPQLKEVINGLRISSFVMFPYVALGLAMAAVVRSTTLAATNPFARIERWEVWTWIAICSMVLVLQSVLLSLGESAPRKRPFSSLRNAEPPARRQ